MKILIIGFYFKDNAGDNFFCEAFREMFPEYGLTFTNYIDENLANQFEIFIIGGGSFLNQDLPISNRAFKIIENKAIFYVGVGAETEISQSHFTLLKKAKYVFIRSAHKDKIPNNNCMVIPDIVFSLKNKVIQGAREKKSVLIFPNISVVPQHHNPYWKFTAWEHFKNEFAQFLDELVQDGYEIKFLGMCDNPTLDDNAAAYEIINRMKIRKKYILYPYSRNFCSYSNIISKQSIVISERYHSTVLAQMTDTPYISIGHHHKFDTVPNIGAHLSFFSISKNQLKETFISTLATSPKKEIDLHIFEEVKKIIAGQINEMGSIKK